MTSMAKDVYQASAGPATVAAVPLRQEIDVQALVRSAAAGDRRSWSLLVSRYAPLVRRITGQYHLSRDDANDVAQVVWLRLFEHIGRLREPRALPGWIATVSRNEALKVLMAAARWSPVDPLCSFLVDREDHRAGPEEALVRAEQCQATRAGLADLEPHQRELILLLQAELPYTEIGQRMLMPVGSIGPTRARLLKKLRETSAIKRISEQIPA